MALLNLSSFLIVTFNSHDDFLGCEGAVYKIPIYRNVVERIEYREFHMLGERGTGEEAFKIFKKTFDSVRPMVEVKSRRGGVAPEF